MTRRRILRVLERALLGMGALCLGGYLALEAGASAREAAEGRRLDAYLREEAAPTASSRPSSPDADAPPSPDADASLPDPAAPRTTPAAVARTSTTEPPQDLVGRLEVPRLGLRVLVAEGVGERTLLWAAGRLPGTARPGEPGNLVVAGHRDRVFAPLRDIHAGDEVSLVTHQGTYRYVVDWTEIVSPQRVEVLAPTEQASLTLVTCYPFNAIGAAPQRFIVRARLAS